MDFNRIRKAGVAFAGVPILDMEDPKSFFL
jgi:hypothetical protein